MKYISRNNGNGNDNNGRHRSPIRSILDFFIYLGRNLWVRQANGEDEFQMSDDLEIKDMEQNDQDRN
ncbi:hypothetical protein NIES4071_49680 [Calothrix sp. NIES-4071]|nr:hypothetical protein NIES4071_49680 [Calothrix sp. NIES-4071]BAZ59275.1 hypothetical protein NIES4105_49620 [Calothrix sp. NIES-4105]